MSEELKKEDEIVSQSGHNLPENLSAQTMTFEQIKSRRKKIFSEADYKEQEKMISALEKTSQFLAVETDIHLILTRIAETLLKAIGARYVNFWDFTPDRKSLFITAAAGMQEQYLAHSRRNPIVLGTAWTGRAAVTGQPWATIDVQKDPLLPSSWLPAAKKQNYHGLLCVPLKAKGETIGSMCVYYKDIHEFDYFEVLLVNIAANQAATAVSNARLFGELLAERNKTLATIKSLNDGLIMYDLEGRIVLINPKAQELLWLKEEDVVNRILSHEYCQDNIFLKNLYAIKNLPLTEFEYKEFTTEGPQKVVLNVTMVPVRDQYKTIGTMQVLHDITKEKEVELLKSSFVTVASHQLRTPLSAIKWGLDSFLKGDVGQLNGEQIKLAEKIFSSNEHLIGLVNDILDVSRIEEGRFGYEFELGNLGSLVEKVYDELKFQATASKINFVLEKPSFDLPPVMLDPEKLDIAIRNVFDNAIKYTLAGGVVKIKFQLSSDGKFSFLKVEDNGIGILEKDQKFIFVRFFRGKNAIKHQTEGSGLGLYIAKKIAEKHNASLFFESKENVGSVFVFQFPLEKEKMPKAIVADLAKTP